MGKYSLMPSGRFYIHLILLTGPFPFFLKVLFCGGGGGGGLLPFSQNFLYLMQNM